MKYYLTAATLVLLLVAAAAMTAYAGELLSLDLAVETALKNHPNIKAADSQVEGALANVVKSKSGFLPKVTLSETWSKTDNPLMVLGTKLNQEMVTPSDFNPAVINDPDPLSNYNTRLSVIQPVFNGGKEYLGVKQARLASDAAAQDRARVRQETMFNVVKAYYGLCSRKNMTAGDQSSKRALRT
jgi:outer membrane protein TolC